MRKISIQIFIIDFDFKMGKDCYHKVILEEWKYIVKENTLMRNLEILRMKRILMEKILLIYTNLTKDNFLLINTQKVCTM